MSLNIGIQTIVYIFVKHADPLNNWCFVWSSILLKLSLLHKIKKVNKNIFVQLGFSVSNWHKIQLNTDLLKLRAQVFIPNAKVQLNLNEIKAIKNRLKVRLNLGRSFNLQKIGEKLEP